MSKTDDTANSKPAFLDFLRPKRESVTEDEIKDMVAENIELLEDEKRMINDILDLADMTVREIMKPRVDMIMAEDTEPARAALDRMRGTGYSRLPVYHEEVDEVIGLVSYKDLIGPLLDGRIEDPVAECMMNRSVFFLTGGTETPASLCQKLTDAGMGEAHGVVGENLGTEAEAIRYGSAAELAGQSFAPLSVLLVENFDLPQLRAPGFPDESFIRSEVPMTKQEVRAAALAKLAVMPTDTLWDVGAGTGSVSVELALAAPKGRVYAVECEPDACELIRKNRAKFHACNLILIEGRAPDVLADLPAPDAVFIGGTKGGMEAVLDEVLGKNPNARICISAIALETLGAAIAALTARGLTAEVTQIAVSRTKPAGRLHLLMANNPIFLITGTRK